MSAAMLCGGAVALPAIPRGATITTGSGRVRVGVVRVSAAAPASSSLLTTGANRRVGGKRAGSRSSSIVVRASVEQAISDIAVGVGLPCTVRLR